MSPVAWAVLALIVAGCLYVLWLALQDPGRDPFLEVDDVWPGEVHGPDVKPWRSAEPVSLPGDEGYDEAWLQAMQDPKTPDEIQQAHDGAERLRAAMHEQALQQGDEFIHGMTDGGGER